MGWKKVRKRLSDHFLFTEKGLERVQFRKFEKKFDAGRKRDGERERKGGRKIERKGGRVIFSGLFVFVCGLKRKSFR